MLNDQAAPDVLIFIALEEELKEFAAIANFPLISEEIYSGLRIYSHTIITDSGAIAKCSTVLIGDQGMENAASAAARILQLTSPKMVINVGISGRIDSEYKLCDVILANEVDDPLYRAKAKDGRIQKAGRSFPLALMAEPFYQSIQTNPLSLLLDTQFSTEELTHLRTSSYIGDRAEVRIGPILATPYVIDDVEFADSLKERNRLYGAADMESAAIVAECWKSTLVDGQILVVRGVSDPANGRKRELDKIRDGIIRKIAMKNASVVVVAAVKRLNFEDPKPSLIRLRNTVEKRDCFQFTLNDLVPLLNGIENLIARGEEISSIISAIKAQIKTHRHEVQLFELARYAYLSEVEDISNDLDLRGINSTARDFLVAIHVMGCVLADPKTNAAEESHFKPLTFVYPQRVNRFCKGILSLETDEFNVTNRLLRASELFAKKHRATKRKKNTQSSERSTVTGYGQQRAHACYLLGRLKTAPQKQKAAEILERWLNEVFIGKDGSDLDRDGTLVRKLRRLESKEDRMLVRTILISLVLLGKTHKSDDYLKACLRDRKFDELNRGFHLEYYGDLEYHKKESMSHVDDLRSFPKTFSHLFEKVLKSFETESAYPLRDIELQTLLSLCQHRHLRGLLPDEYRTSLLDLLSRVPNSSISQQLQLRSFAHMLQRHLASSFGESSLAVEVYQLKKRPRSGWNSGVRSVRNPESIMAHICGGLKLIQLYLPERLSKDDIDSMGVDSCRGYSKDRILRMFLVHDWAEAYTGDLLPKERTEETNREEELFMSEIDNFGTYPNVEMGGTFALWVEFRNGASINARLAKEIDKLENLLQLELEFGCDENKIPDYFVWKGGLLNEIRTPLGRRIADILSVKR